LTVYVRRRRALPRLPLLERSETVRVLDVVDDEPVGFDAESPDLSRVAFTTE
jgi:hypothetical protein